MKLQINIQNTVCCYWQTINNSIKEYGILHYNSTHFLVEINSKYVTQCCNTAYTEH